MQVERPSGKFRARWAQLSLLPWCLVLLSRVCPKTHLGSPLSIIPLSSSDTFSTSLSCMIDLLLVRIAAPIAIAYETKTRNARTTFLNSSAYLVVLGLPALLLNRLHLECVSSPVVVRYANYIAKMIGLTPLIDNKYTFNLLYADI